MPEKEEVQSPNGQSSLRELELAQRIEEQSIKDQPEGILESATQHPQKSGNQSQQSSSKQVKKSQGKQAKSDQNPSKKPKKKIEGAALIGIDIAKEADFSEWYTQVLTKGDFLDYYDVSGCTWFPELFLPILHTIFGRNTNFGRNLLHRPVSLLLFSKANADSVARLHSQALVVLHLGGSSGLFQ